MITRLLLYPGEASVAETAHDVANLEEYLRYRVRVRVRVGAWMSQCREQSRVRVRVRVRVRNSYSEG